MKKVLTLCMMALACVALFSCDDDNDSGTPAENEYVFKATIQMDKQSETVDQQRQILEDALKNAGISTNAFTFVLTGKDSTEADGKLNEKMAQVEKAIEESPVKIVGSVEIKGIEKRYLDKEDKEHPITSWYCKEYGITGLTGGVPHYEPLCEDGLIFSSKHDYHWVKSLRTSDDDDEGDTYESIDLDLNKGSGGDDIYLIFEHYGSKKDDKAIFTYPETYITDVIAVYSRSSSSPQSLTIDGRTYTKQTNVCDLNAGAGGDYIWLYTTNQPAGDNWSDYKFLTTGGHEKSGCFALYDNTWFGHDNFNASEYVPASYYNLGRYFEYRVVQAYDVNGNHKGEADLNHGAKGYYIKLVLTYAIYR